LHVVAWMVPLLLLQGAGLGMVMAPLVSTVLAGLPPQHAGVASGVLAMVQQASNALGVALIGILFYGRLGSTADAAGHGAAFAVALGYLVVSALLVAFIVLTVPPGLASRAFTAARFQAVPSAKRMVSM